MGEAVETKVQTIRKQADTIEMMTKLFRRTLITLFTLLSGGYSSLLFAQRGSSRASKGAQVLSDASSALKGYFEPAVTLIYVVAALVGLIGAVKVYNKFASGDQDTGKVAASWGGACVFLVIAAYALELFFLS